MPWADLLNGLGAFTPDTIELQLIAANRNAAMRLVDQVGYDD